MNQGIPYSFIYVKLEKGTPIAEDYISVPV